MVFNDSLICFPVVKDAGLDSLLTEHFRSAEYHFLYDTVSSSWQVMERSCYEKGHCESVGELVLPKMSALLVRKIGKNAYREMLKKGVSVWMTQAITVREAIQEWQSGVLVPLLECELPVHSSHCKKTHPTNKIGRRSEKIPI